MVETEERQFKCGMQVERGYVKVPPGSGRWRLESDWDWHRLIKVLKPKNPMEKELKRLVVREGFALYGGSWEEGAYFTRSDFPSMSKLRRVLMEAPKNRWAGFQVFYSMAESEVRNSAGVDLVESMLAVFAEVTPAMNLCTQTQLVLGS